MISFKVLKNSKKSNARIGWMQTPHGDVETPSFVPVATNAVVKTLTSEEVNKSKSQILISNTFHLHLKPGENVVKRLGGLQKFMSLKKPLMTDSAGYQVFSLGFGRDYKMGKTARTTSEKLIKNGAQPQNLRITDEGVFFRSPYNGNKLFIGPKESIRIQESLGADIILAFDECPPPYAEYKYMQDSMERTHRWARKCISLKKTSQALYGIVQGGRFNDLRARSAECIAKMPFDGVAIGGEFGAGKNGMQKMIHTVLKEMPKHLPRHLLGIGRVEDFIPIIKEGVDTFDCTVPTHYARHGTAFTSHGALDLQKTIFLSQKKSLDSGCICEVCAQYSRSYISHLIRAREITGLRLLTLHNLFYFNTVIEELRNKIKNGKL